MSLITRIHPKTLFTEFYHFMLANGVQHVVVPKGEHHANGPAEKGIGSDIDRISD
jgi:hypothetical protein